MVIDSMNIGAIVNSISHREAKLNEMNSLIDLDL